MKPNTQFLLNDIIFCTQKAEELRARIAPKQFMQLSNEGLAGVACFRRIGLAMKQLPFEIRAKHPEIEWNQMIAYSEKLIERYWETEMQEISTLTEKQLPELQKAVRKILQELEN